MPRSCLCEGAGGGLTLRPAGLEDAPILLAWRNDPETRAACRNTGPVEAGEHAAWLAGLLGEPARRLYIVVAHGQPCGQVRLDPMGDGLELSWTIAPQHRKKGYARRAVSLVARAFSERTLTAWIRPENHASIRVAEAAGFRLAGTRDGLLKFVALGVADVQGR